MKCEDRLEQPKEKQLAMIMGRIRWKKRACGAQRWRKGQGKKKEARKEGEEKKEEEEGTGQGREKNEMMHQRKKGEKEYLYPSLDMHLPLTHSCLSMHTHGSTNSGSHSVVLRYSCVNAKTRSNGKQQVNLLLDDDDSCCSNPIHVAGQSALRPMSFALFSLFLFSPPPSSPFISFAIFHNEEKMMDGHIQEKKIA
jgi:hypothetical protein